MEKHQQNIDSEDSDKVGWLANQIFTAFSQDVVGLTFYVLNCCCIYYQRAYRDGELDQQIGIYRDTKDGPCGMCMHLDKDWKDRLLDEVTVYNTKVQVRSD